MNSGIKENLKNIVEKSFAHLIEEYQLKIVSLDNDELFLVGNNYALQFTVDRFELAEVMYIERKSCSNTFDCSLIMYSLRKLRADRFTSEDRALYGSPITKTERVQGIINIYVSGLGRRCQDLLQGDKSWLNRRECRVGPVNSIVQKTLENEL